MNSKILQQLDEDAKSIAQAVYISFASDEEILKLEKNDSEVKQIFNKALTLIQKVKGNNQEEQIFPSITMYLYLNEASSSTLSLIKMLSDLQSLNEIEKHITAKLDSLNNKEMTEKFLLFDPVYKNMLTQNAKKIIVGGYLCHLNNFQSVLKNHPKFLTLIEDALKTVNRVNYIAGFQPKFAELKDHFKLMIKAELHPSNLSNLQKTLSTILEVPVDAKIIRSLSSLSFETLITTIETTLELVNKSVGQKSGASNAENHSFKSPVSQPSQGDNFTPSSEQPKIEGHIIKESPTI